MMLQWDDTRVRAMDCETSGVKPEYALQPWRHTKGEMWITSFVHLIKEGGKFRDIGGLGLPLERPSDDHVKKMIAEFFREVEENDQYVVGWNLAYDAAVMIAYGFEEEVFRTKWLDGMLLWRHWFIEPEYDKDRGKKKPYGLKDCFAELLPELPAYNDDIDFHDPDPAVRQRLHRYNVRDSKAAFGFARHWFKLLQEYPQRLKAALIEAECIPFIAQANLRGIPVDTLYAKELSGCRSCSLPRSWRYWLRMGSPRRSSAHRSSWPRCCTTTGSCRSTPTIR